ncbi:glycosyltransferase family 25 protein [Neptunicella sp. SCSIO 80796]|uniref:glycosyltransferase family 25 protein n=1 Tax=Neptunicella plasticusilytica TaxID=3117012 RepID=UPI003A4DAD4D
MNNHYKTLLINLAHSTDRLAHSSDSLKKIGIQFERIEAVNGHTFVESGPLPHYNVKLNHDTYHKNLNNGEIGCYLSHRKAWQKIVDEQLSFAVILEDDFSLTGDLAKAIDIAKKTHRNWDYIKLAGHRRSRYPIHSQSIADMQLVTYNKLPSQTCAQLVSFSGAKKLLAKSEQFGRPVDVDIQHWWEADLQVFGLLPYVIVAKEAFGSEIDRIATRREASKRHFKKIWLQLRFWLKNSKENKRRVRMLKSR